MTDSADDLLAKIREANSGEWSGGWPEDVACRQMARAFSELDVLLTSGGPLPTAWTEPVREMRRVQDLTRPACSQAALDGLAATLPWTAELVFRSPDGAERHHWHAPFLVTSLDQEVRVKLDLGSIEVREG